RISESQLDSEEIEFFKINRGGDITYHGPGQITGYLILDLDQYYHDLHRYVRDIEEMIIRTIKTYGLVGDRIEGYTGVWLPPTDVRSMSRKVCAIGIHMSRWVSMHGFALNVNTDLSYFENIIPCGIAESNMTVTSIQHELGRRIDVPQVESILLNNFQEVLGAQLV
ncbi:MAG: lipoyl(octanoyl) transferase LipB, partial [Bacteroidota bacterium]